MNEALLFDPEAHQYYLDGVKIPSVTQLTAAYGSFDFDEYPDMELTVEAAAERGTLLHGYLEHRLAFGDPEDYELPAALEPYADAIDLFLSEHTVDPFFVERMMWAERNGVTFAGTPDLVADFDGALSILDWKFVSQVQKAKVGAQLKGYDALCCYNGVFPDALYCVQFLPDGTYRLYPVERTPDAFDACLFIQQVKTRKQPKGRII